MARVLIAYARDDGINMAARLRAELERGGHTVWRDVEAMHAGADWKDQIRNAIRSVDAVVVLLTSASVASKYVEWEWETAFTLGKDVICLLIQDCPVPDALKPLHYHDLRTSDQYVLGIMALNRDLAGLSKDAQSVEQPQAPKFVIHHMERSVAGDWGIADNRIYQNASQETTTHLRNIEGLLASLKMDMNDQHRQQVEHVTRLAQFNEIDDQEMKILLEGVFQLIKAVEAGQIKMETNIERIVGELSATSATEVGLQHYFELTVPIIPGFVSYKYEAGAGTTADLAPVLASVREVWEKLLRRKK